MKRRTFLTGLGTGLVAAPLLLKVSACDDGGGDITSSGGPTGGDGDGDQAGFRVENTDISHPHSFVVLCADEGADEVTYTAGGSGHTHPVTLTGEQLDTIFAGGSVTIETDDSHPHTWVVSLPDEGCAGPADPPTDLDTTTSGGW